MVKNFGGNKSKKIGRKFVNAPQDRRVRFAEEVEELYSVVTKMFGNGMCEVKCIDGKTRLCIFRKKFKGRSKRDNMVSIGTVVLVGIRTWEVISSESTKLEKCDLLEVYSPGDVKKLKKMASWEKWSNLAGACEFSEENFDAGDDGLEFVADETAHISQKKKVITSYADAMEELLSDSDSDDSEEDGEKSDKKEKTPPKSEQESVEQDSVFNFTQENVKISSPIKTAIQATTKKTTTPEAKKKKVSEDDDDFNIDDI